MKKLKRLFFLVLIVLLVLAGLQIKSGYEQYKEALLEKPLETAVSEIQGKANYTAYEEIPRIYFEATVAVEDRRFYLHHGFDIVGTLRAVYNDLKAWELLEGGSTISQQLAKNLYFPMDNSISRKIAEVFMALDIEKTYDKQEVLELYANSIYYGSGYYSVYDASMGYFKKEPSMMSDYECTLLAGIPNAPSVYSLDVNPSLAHERQKKVVASMVKSGYITEAEKERILNGER